MSKNVDIRSGGGGQRRGNDPPTSLTGAAAERIRLGCYMLFIVINFSIIYTIPVHWMWSGTGWLGTRGASDFAGIIKRPFGG